MSQATGASAEDFGRECRTLAQLLSRDDGTSRLEHQRAQRRVRRWVDRRTGMHHLHAELDPEAAATVNAALDAATKAVRAAARGEDANWDHATTDALVELITGARSLDARVPEVAVQIDWHSLIDGLHEHLVHEGGWTLQLAPDRTITLIRPEGTVTVTGPTTDRQPTKPSPTTTAATGEQSDPGNGRCRRTAA